MGRREGKVREKELEGVNLLALAPFRRAEWEESDGRVVVLRPFPTTHGLRGKMDRFFHRLSANRIRLDEVGSFAWLNFDGSLTVAEVAHRMTEEFGDQVNPVEERLGRLVWMMRGQGFLGYPGWDDSAEALRYD
jgi:hypothetical protein